MASPKRLQGENLKEAKRHVSAAHVVFIRAENQVANPNLNCQNVCTSTYTQRKPRR